ncbi:hypothetical protein A2160_05995 [Candidatus Beckwithbacteria bacterium RBG_13_42_9]|uniref:General secretion pathway GspH domain-containing protein n=1 Tax=Candidatus Beckwithbacteria bacterium RBG_13_42_9 TaxID=1797457 RepID=A0A1F5E5H7_9BACT|nr:MAG: hypothetical protein A2160_05995 [Candidatus Beckwithbacteria bacterium RBG_13_42_9]
MTIVISGILIGLGIASYNTFNQRQTLNLALRTLRTNLWAAQSRAQAGKRPLTGCTNFTGYLVSFNLDNYQLAADCDEGQVNIETINLPNSVRLQSAPCQILFKTGQEGTDLTADLTLQYVYQSTSETQSVIITVTGEIK